MDAIYFHPAGHKHHFRNVEIKDGLADLKDDDGKLVYAAVPISTEPMSSHCVLSGEIPATKKK